MRVHRDTLAVIAIAVAVEAALLIGLTWPLWLGRAPWSIIDWEPLSAMLGESPAGLARFLVTLGIWSGGYLAAVALSRRPLPAAARWALIVAPAVFVLTLLPTWPAASKDLYHYIMEGRALVVHGANPMVTPPALLPPDPLYWILSSWEWEPSRYGPLWALIAAVPTLLAGESLRGQVLSFKAITAAAFLALAALVYLAVHRKRPSEALAAYVLVAWNPLVLFEAGASGHNDLIMLALTMLALEQGARRHWALAFPALAAAVLIKYITGLLGPLLLLWAWRTARDRRERRAIAVGLVLALTLVVGCYALFWEGAATLRAVRGAADEALNSPGWLIVTSLEHLGLARRPATVLMASLLAPLFVTAYALALRRVWRAPDGLTSLWQAGLLVLAVEISTVSWWFWPWYVTWLMPLAGLLAGRRAALLALIWSLAALVAYVPITFRPLFWGPVPDRRMPFAVALTVFLPAAIAVWLLYRRKAGRAAPPGHA